MDDDSVVVIELCPEGEDRPLADSWQVNIRQQLRRARRQQRETAEGGRKSCAGAALEPVQASFGEPGHGKGAPGSLLAPFRGAALPPEDDFQAGWAKTGFGSVIASLERRAYDAVDEYSSDEQSDSSLDGEADGERDGGNSPESHREEGEDLAEGESKVGADLASDGNNKGGGKRRKPKQAARKPTKEEREWLDEGKDLLADDQYEDYKDPIWEDMEKDLPFDAFYVHRGPLLSKERAAHYAQRREKERLAAERKKLGRGKKNGKAKLGKATAVPSAGGSAAAVEAGVAGSSAARATNGAVHLKKKQQMLLKRSIKRIHTALTKLESEKAKKRAAAAGQANASADDQTPPAQGEKPDPSANKGDSVACARTSAEGPTDPEAVFLVRDIDTALLPLADVINAIEHEEAEAHILHSLGRLFPGVAEDRIKSHIHRVKCAHVAKVLREAHRDKLKGVHEYIAKRLAACRPERLPSAPTWKAQVESTEKLTTEILEKLYFREEEVVEPEGKLADGDRAAEVQPAGEWKPVLDLLQSRVTEHPIPGNKRHDRALVQMCMGYCQRRVDGTGCFMWDRAGLSLLRQWGKAHKKAYLAAAEAWELEDLLLPRLKTLTRDRDTQLDELVGKWPNGQMSRAELLEMTSGTYTSPCRPNKPLKLFKSGKKPGRPKKSTSDETTKSQSPSEKGTATTQAAKPKKQRATPAKGPPTTGIPKGSKLANAADQGDSGPAQALPGESGDAGPKPSSATVARGKKRPTSDASPCATAPSGARTPATKKAKAAVAGKGETSAGKKRKSTAKAGASGRGQLAVGSDAPGSWGIKPVRGVEFDSVKWNEGDFPELGVAQEVEED